MELKDYFQIIKNSIIRLSPIYLKKNPVMFLTEISFLLSLMYMFFIKEFSFFYVSITVLIFATVWFGTFADSYSEHQAKITASSLLKVTSNLSVRKILPNGSEVYVPPDAVSAEDVILVKENEIIPLDGVIVEGVAAIDESLVTGESLPVIKSVNDEVISGSKVVSDWIKVRVTKTLKESYVYRIAGMIEKTKRPKGESEKQLDILIYGLTLLLSFVVFSLGITINLLGYSLNLPILLGFYVCLLPTTIGALEEAIGISGLTRLWNINVVSKSGKAIEAAGDIDVVLLDKTGTITVGKREPVKIIPLGSHTEEEVAKALFLSSVQDDTQEGKAILRYLQSKNYLPSEIDQAIISSYEEFSAKTRKSGIYYKSIRLPGKEIYKEMRLIRKSDFYGVYLNEKMPIFKGAPDVMKSIFRAPPDFDEKLEEIAKEGGTPLAVAVGDEIIGLVELKDVLKEGVKEQIEALKSMGIEPYMVTGDHPITAQIIASEVGINNVISQAKPEDKYKKVIEEQSKGKTIAMVGDGTNDAPALARANVGLAMYSGTEVAKEAANMIDLESDPSKIIDVIKLGKQLLITRGSLATFSIANDVSKYFVVLPALLSFLSVAKTLNVLHLPLHVAVIAALIYNALIIPILMPIAIKGISFKPRSPKRVFLENVLIYGLGGVILPFLAIKLIGILIMVL
ncbi:MAG: potassium-transporting ATPase subunit KdpB [Conexivisphaerales archaeon]|nr:potassium-transporting ATPase subunit KdpB [Conexivisphaerales archaeon]